MLHAVSLDSTSTSFQILISTNVSLGISINIDVIRGNVFRHTWLLYYCGVYNGAHQIFVVAAAAMQCTVVGLGLQQ